MSQLWEIDKVNDKFILKGAWCLLESLMTFLSLDLLALLTLIVILSLSYFLSFLSFFLKFDIWYYTDNTISPTVGNCWCGLKRTEFNSVKIREYM